MILKHKSMHYVGMYAKACDACVIAGHVESSSFYNQLSSFSKKLVRIDITGSPAITFFTVLNSKSVILPFFTGDEVVSRLKSEGLEVNLYKGKNLALGNLVAANDKGAVCSYLLEKQEVKQIGEWLGVEAVQLDIMPYSTPGSFIVPTNKGVCVSPVIRHKLSEIEEILKTKGEIVTCSMGSAFLHIGIVANSYGALVGSGSSGFEMGQVESALGLV